MNEVEENVDGFDPGGVDAFRFVSRRIFEDDEDVVVELVYGMDGMDGRELTERVRFPGVSLPEDAEVEVAVDRVARLLHLVAGVSYYKAAAPARLVVESGGLRESEHRFLNDLYLHGLAEFAYMNEIDLRERINFEFKEIPEDAGTGTDAPKLKLERRTAVPVGGGKDSIVTIEALRRGGEPVVLFSVGGPKPILDTVEVSGLDHVQVERELDPQLVALNKAGALNGHVPVTAVVSTIAVLAGLFYGWDAVAMSNERSASTGSFEWNGSDVNHQYSKGIEFERGLRGLLAAQVPGLDYFSFLRSAPEPAVARSFSRLEAYHQVFTSCNAVFRRDPARRADTWCGDCPKCRFVYLALAPFIAPEEMTEIFGRDLLADPVQLEGFRALIGAGDPKPFECVGEESESRALFGLLAKHPEWRDHQVVQDIAVRDLSAHMPDPSRAFATGGEDFLPARLRETFDSNLGA